MVLVRFGTSVAKGFQGSTGPGASSFGGSFDAQRQAVVAGNAGRWPRELASNLTVEKGLGVVWNAHASTKDKKLFGNSTGKAVKKKAMRYRALGYVLRKAGMV